MTRSSSLQRAYVCFVCTLAFGLFASSGKGQIVVSIESRYNFEFQTLVLYDLATGARVSNFPVTITDHRFQWEFEDQGSGAYLIYLQSSQLNGPARIPWSKTLVVDEQNRTFSYVLDSGLAKLKMRIPPSLGLAFEGAMLVSLRKVGERFNYNYKSLEVESLDELVVGFNLLSPGDYEVSVSSLLWEGNQGVVKRIQLTESDLFGNRAGVVNVDFVEGDKVESPSLHVSPLTYLDRIDRLLLQ